MRANMLIDEVKECSKCGICRSVCPVFLIANDEVMSPRGRLSLIEAMLEGVSISDIDTIRSCIKCSRCSVACPVGVKVERIIQSSRNILSEIPDNVRSVFRASFNPGEFKSLIESSKSDMDIKNEHQLFCSGKAKTLTKNEEQLPLWQLPLLFHGNAYLPELAEKTILDNYPEYISPYIKERKKIALFVGCSINYANTNIADSLIESLKKLGIGVFIPGGQICCGAPMLLYGDTSTASEMARKNISALRSDEFDAVITLCPACGVTMKSEYSQLLNEDIGNFVSKVCDASEFIYKSTDYMSRSNKPSDVSVTYHDPCYLRIRQKVKKEPREILGKSAHLIEMKDADKCCGLGGTLGIFHPEISIRIAEAKIESIVDSGADIVTTGCPGCITFLKDQLGSHGINKEVLHTVQMMNI